MSEIKPNTGIRATTPVPIFWNPGARPKTQGEMFTINVSNPKDVGKEFVILVPQGDGAKPATGTASVVTVQGKHQYAPNCLRKKDCVPSKDHVSTTRSRQRVWGRSEEPPLVAKAGT